MKKKTVKVMVLKEKELTKVVGGHTVRINPTAFLKRLFRKKW